MARAKSISSDIYIKWQQVVQKSNQTVTAYQSYIVYLKSLLLINLKLNVETQLTNFRRGLRIKHRQKLYNLPKKNNLRDFIDQILDFEKKEKLTQKNKKKRERDANNENENQNDNKRQRFTNNGRGRGNINRGRNGSNRGRERGD